MKLVHTTYFLTTVLFILIASFLLTEQPIQRPHVRADMSEQIQYSSQQTQEKNTSQSEASSKDLLAHMPKVQVVATGYYAGVQSTGKNESHPEYGITYSGVKVIRDMNAYSTIAADLRVFPLGTILFIPGYGYGVVADIGSAIKGNKIDLYFDTIDDVYNQWGKKTLDVYVVKRGNGVFTEAMMKQLNKNQLVQANVQLN